MPKFKIAIEDTQVVIRAKVIEADSLEEALDFASGEDWSGEDWHTVDEHARCEFREDLHEGPGTELGTTDDTRS